METTKAKLSFCTEIMKFMFVVTIAIGTAIATLLFNNSHIPVADYNFFMGLCVFMAGVITIILCVLIFFIFLLFNKLEEIEEKN